MKAFLSLLALVLAAGQARAEVRIRDLTFIHGARDNQLIGYGLVTGLAGDGDKDPVYTVQTIANMLQRYGMSLPASAISSKNVAAVMVTADIPAFAANGSKIDVTVSAMGDAKSIQGGVLLQTPLIGADGKMYAVAQGPIAVGGFLAGGGGAGGATVQKNHPTTGQIIGGAQVERTIPVTLVRGDSVEFILREGDFSTSARMAEAINAKYPNSSIVVDPARVRVKIPEIYMATPIDFVSHVQQILVTPDTPARLVINERTGTIVASARIQISSCAVSQGNIIVNIAQSQTASQPGPFAQAGQTAVLNNTTTGVTEQKSRVVALGEMPTVEKVAEALNRLGATPRDMMAIFQAMKQAGALQAELIIR